MSKDQEDHIQCEGVRAAILDGEEGQAEVVGGQAWASGGPDQRDGGLHTRWMMCGVQARVKDPFGGERVWRSYWKRKVIADELVQRRINQFSAMLPEIRGCEAFNGGTNGGPHYKG